MRPAVRVSTDADGEHIHELLQGMGFTIDGLDWSQTGGFFLVAEMDDRIVGSVQLIVGKPIGWIELLAYDQSLGHVARARTVKALVDNAVGGLGLFGASAVMGYIPFDLKSYKRVVKKRGGVIVNSGNLFAKRLR